MGKLCKKCGMTSDRDDLCTWCNADLREPKKTKSADVAASGPKSPTTVASPKSSSPSSKIPAPVVHAPPVPERPAWMIPGIVGGVVVLGIIIGLMITGSRMMAAPPEAGQDWPSVSTKVSGFSVMYPSSWGEPSSSGSSGTYVLMSWSPTPLCYVEIQGTATAGAVGDTAAALERAMASEGGTVPVEQSADGALLPLFEIKQGLKNKAGYSTGAPQYSTVFAGQRNGWQDYSYKRRAGIKSVTIKGERFTSYQREYGYQAYCEAPEKHWDTFRPIAEQVLATVKFGGGG